MSDRQRVGRGLLGSLKRQVRKDVRELFRSNPTLHDARYSVVRRLFRVWIVNRPIGQMLALYLLLLGLTLIAEWIVSRERISLLDLDGDALRGFLKDVDSYFIATQVGVLAIVTVAVGVVTLLSQRDDGSSVKTDVRLYYVESFSYEVATSGVALLLVLTFQLFWPLQYLLHLAHLGGPGLSFKFFLTGIHTVWLAVNLVLFLQFITTTLRFVEPVARERLREQFSANVMLPRDIEQRLLQTLYVNAPTSALGLKELTKGPHVMFGHGAAFLRNASVEISSSFKKAVRLNDIWISPLLFAIRSWRRRVRSSPQDKRRITGDVVWDSTLAILIDFDQIKTGTVDWALRDGGVPFRRYERFLIRHSFRFRRNSDRDTESLTPADFIAELTDKVMGLINKSATTGFSSALDELVRYHKFVLASQNTRDEAGNAFSFAEVGGYLERPDQEWIRQYRRLFDTAVEKMTTDAYFIRRLGNVAALLLPEKIEGVPSRVINTILNLGAFEIVALEAWVTRRALIAAGHDETSPTSGVQGAETGSPHLAGSDHRAYEQTLIDFVGSWESLEQVLVLMLGLHSSQNTPAPRYWRAVAVGWPILEAHLHNNAFFFASAVWNDDALGAIRFRDLLLRWLQPFYADLENEYRFRSGFLVTPEVAEKDWDQASAIVAPLLRFSSEHLSPRSCLGLVLRGAHDDVVCICGAVALRWYSTHQQPSSIAADAAIQTLQRQKLASEGSDLTRSGSPKTVFRLVFDLLIRRAIVPSYATTLDQLIRSLNGMASPRMVPGRVYSGWGFDGLDTLRPQFLAIMAATLPDGGKQIVDFTIDLARTQPVFSEDKTLRGVIWQFSQLLVTLQSGLDQQAFARSLELFDVAIDVDERKSLLTHILENLVAGLDAIRIERLKAAPLDEAKMEAVRASLSTALLNQGPDVYCFGHFRIHERDALTISVREGLFGEIDRGAFVHPPMSAIDIGQYEDFLVNALRGAAAKLLWEEFGKLPQTEISIDISEDRSNFWRTVIAAAEAVGQEPTVLVPLSLGEGVSSASYGISSNDDLQEFKITRESEIESGGGFGYAGTVDGVRVFMVNSLTESYRRFLVTA
jgi:hypothetical protein